MDATRNDESRSTPVARRIRDLGAYLFADLDRKKAQALAQGRDVIDLGVGDPDLPTFDHIVERLTQAAKDPGNHQYPSYSGKPELRRAIAAYMERRFSVSLDPDKEILVLIGSKEGIAHLAWAMLDPGDRVVVPDPGYPVYASTAKFCGAQVLSMPLTRQRGFLPDEDEAASLFEGAKLAWLNYPNNPTSATADLAFYERFVALARRRGVFLANDASYAEVYLEDQPPPSILQVPGAKDLAVEFFSLSKTFNMTGWRVGWVAGNAEVIAALGKVKQNVDSGVFGAVQDAAIAALASDWAPVERLRGTYRRRRDILVEGLTKAGWDLDIPKATFFVLAAVPEGMSSMEAAAFLLDRADIVATPASAMGAAGEGFIRFSLTSPEERLAEAAKRIAEVGRPAGLDTKQ